MQEHNLFAIYLEKLNRLDIPYFVTGSVASIIYGEPRLTHDTDNVVFLKDSYLKEFISMFPSDKHISDIKSMIMNSCSKIDFNFIRQNIKSDKMHKILDLITLENLSKL